MTHSLIMAVTTFLPPDDFVSVLNTQVYGPTTRLNYENVSPLHFIQTHMYTQ